MLHPKVSENFLFLCSLSTGKIYQPGTNCLSVFCATSQFPGSLWFPASRFLIPCRPLCPLGWDGIAGAPDPGGQTRCDRQAPLYELLELED